MKDLNDIANTPNTPNDSVDTSDQSDWSSLEAMAHTLSNKENDDTQSSKNKTGNKPPTKYEIIDPFGFPPDNEEYQILSKQEMMAKKGRFFSDSEVKLHNQTVADKRIEYFTSKLEELTPKPEDFIDDPGRDKNRIEACRYLEEDIIDRQSNKNFSGEDNDEGMDFAFEGLIYKFVDNGLFSIGDRKAKKIFTSRFDDIVNANRNEEAHATDCAFGIPIIAKNKEGKKVIHYFPIALALTTSASQYPSEHSGKTIIEEKLDKYPKESAFVEFASDENGKHLDAQFMPVFVLGFQHDKVRHILTTCDNLDECLTDEIRHNFYSQILSQAYMRIKLISQNHPDVLNADESSTEKKIFLGYKRIYNHFLSLDRELCERLNARLSVPVHDMSAALVVSATNQKIPSNKK